MKVVIMKISIPEPKIIEYLDNLKLKLRSNGTHLRIATRDKNFVFAYLYNITEDVIKDVLLDLKPNDFKFATENTNPNFPTNLLYVFGPRSYT